MRYWKCKVPPQQCGRELALLFEVSGDDEKLNCHFCAWERTKISIYCTDPPGGNKEYRKSQTWRSRLHLGHQFNSDFDESLFFLPGLVIYYFSRFFSTCRKWNFRSRWKKWRFLEEILMPQIRPNRRCRGAEWSFKCTYQIPSFNLLC